MLEIIFENDYDTAAFLQNVNIAAAQILYPVVIHKGTNKIGIQISEPSISIEEFVKPLVAQFILECKENECLTAIIKGNYYFLDHEEQQQILHLAHSVIEGDVVIPSLQDKPPREHYIHQELAQISLSSGSFSIRSFMTFRLAQYHERLREYVESAIEEYKMEQEYQNFIQSLRDYVYKNEPKLEKVHIVHDHQFAIWELRYMSEKEKKKYIDRQFIKEHPMYIDSLLLAPLVSIAPLQIEIYTKDIEHAMIQTIQNIFQERVRLYSLKAFKERTVFFKQSKEPS
ncbi:putative sporulation protein YtxC [Bacillus gobiensis]|uniref:putative sporulation protein YtxC n=1 Tax=Bacillus gobiensis TaxID=1441095 RepID=UPI003D2386C4